MNGGLKNEWKSSTKKASRVGRTSCTKVLRQNALKRTENKAAEATKAGLVNGGSS